MASSPSPNQNTPPLSPQSRTTSAFRFKRKRSTNTTTNDPTQRNPTPKSTRNRRHHHHHHRRSRRAPQDPDPDPDPDQHFRTSLFDALADDEGAAFWEGVYGQPLHTYSPYYIYTYSYKDKDKDNNGGGGGNRNGDGDDDRARDGEANIQKMSDDEYVGFVREKMWERSREGVLRRAEEEVERTRERKEKRKRKEKSERVGWCQWGEESDRREWERGVEAALERGEERREIRKWKVVWEGYLRGWDGFSRAVEEDEVGLVQRKRRPCFKNHIPWPVASGRWEDVDNDAIETFFRMAPSTSSGGVDGFGDVLKKERVRWHPDKMQQRAGEGGIDAGTLKIVTAVFQVVDRMWSEAKGGG